MKKETAPKKAASKPKATDEGKADAPAINSIEMTCHENERMTSHEDERVITHEDEQVTSHRPGRLNSQTVPPAPPDGLIAKVAKPQTTSNFPIDALPSRLQVIIREANATLGFPVDYMAGAILSAMAAAIGNTHSAEAMAGWKEYAILFVALVGCPGVCKSHPLSYVMQPLIDHDAEKAAQFAEALKRYNAAMELPPKERISNGYDLSPVEPRRVRFMMQDVTNEAVHRILSENRRGLVLVSDELAGWFKNFNRYNNGSEAEFWMSVFNHKAAMSDRKSSQSGIMIQNPFMCVVGSIQPAVLTDLAAGSRRANGFMERILYLYPANQDKSLWRICKDEPPVDYIAEWKGVVERLISIVPKTDAKGELIPVDVPFTDDARELIVSWQNKGTRKCNEERCDVLTSIQSKLEIYAIRFSLLLALADWACGSGKKEIDTAVVERAISLAEYFRSTAILVQGIVMEDGLTELQMSVLSCLPDTFTTAEGVAAATRCGMAERSFKRFLRDKKGVLFIRNSHGTYTKF